jgi:hypothetical protein
MDDDVRFIIVYSLILSLLGMCGFLLGLAIYDMVYGL